MPVGMTPEQRSASERNRGRIAPEYAISFGSIDKSNSILVIGSAEITATVSYTHPNWDEAMYDSEDKVLIPFDTVTGKKEVNFDADFSMSITVDYEGMPTEIEELRFRNSYFQYIDLYPYDPYDYK